VHLNSTTANNTWAYELSGTGRGDGRSCPSRRQPARSSAGASCSELRARPLGRPAGRPGTHTSRRRCVASSPPGAGPSSDRDRLGLPRVGLTDSGPPPGPVTVPGGLTGPLHPWSAVASRISRGFESRPQRSTGRCRNHHAVPGQRGDLVSGRWHRSAHPPLRVAVLLGRLKPELLGEVAWTTHSAALPFPSIQHQVSGNPGQLQWPSSTGRRASGDSLPRRGGLEFIRELQ
jgi:hypothetical protein